MGHGLCKCAREKRVCPARLCNTARHHFNEDVITDVSALESAMRPWGATHRVALLAALLTTARCAHFSLSLSLPFMERIIFWPHTAHVPFPRASTRADKSPRVIYVTCPKKKKNCPPDKNDCILQVYPRRFTCTNKIVEKEDREGYTSVK